MLKFFGIIGLLISFTLVWFTVTSYLGSLQVAEEILHNLANSLSLAIENSAFHDPTFENLKTFQSRDVAYFAFIDSKGVYRFHSNHELIGKQLIGKLPLSAISNQIAFCERIKLKTGESVFEYNSPFKLKKEDLVTRITLHTYRSDIVIRRAKLNMIFLLTLLVASWFLILIIYRLNRREHIHRNEMSKRESLAKIGEMGAILAHEIRNPLSGIKGFAQIIDRKPQDDRNAGFAKRIIIETDRLEKLVNDLLSYAQYKNQNHSIIDLSEIIVNTISLLKPDTDGIQASIGFKFSQKCNIDGNSDRLKQLFLNLLKNSIQSIQSGGLINIELSATGKKIYIKISDNGCGISELDLKKIFEPFFTTKAQGSGLGLALCRKIVEEHNGDIKLESILCEGTIVSIYFPLA